MKTTITTLTLVAALSGVAVGATDQQRRAEPTPGQQRTPAVATPTRRPGPPPAAPLSPHAQRLAQTGRANWDRPALSFGFTVVEVAHGTQAQAQRPTVAAAAPKAPAAHPRASEWAARATTLLRAKGLPQSYLHLPHDQVQKLFDANVIDEELLYLIERVQGD